MPTTLICTPLTYYTQVDEELCFAWINKIPCIKSIKGVGRNLELFIETDSISKQDLCNLIGLFDRYKFNNPEQLEVFKNEDNQSWFT